MHRVCGEPAVARDRGWHEEWEDGTEGWLYNGEADEIRNLAPVSICTLEMQHGKPKCELTALAVEGAQIRAARLGVDTEFGLFEDEVTLFRAFPWVSARRLHVEELAASLCKERAVVWVTDGGMLGHSIPVIRCTHAQHLPSSHGTPCPPRPPFLSLSCSGQASAWPFQPQP